MRKPLLIVGSGGHGRVVSEAASLSGWQLAGFIDDTKPVATDVGGIPVLGGFALVSDQETIARYAFAVAIGDQTVRRRVSTELIGAQAELPVILHPSAVISPSARLGCGTVAMANCTINPGASIGRFCILNTGCTVDHDVVLEDGVQIAPGVNLAGRVICRSGVFIGTGAVLIPDVEVGSNTVVGAGSVVIRDVPSDCTLVGNPGQVVKHFRTIIRAEHKTIT